MRFGVFIIALLACEVAHAQTPLPRSRPHAASEAAPHAQITRAVFVAPIPRARPSEAPAKQATAPQKSEPRVSLVPIPRERPAAAVARIVEAVRAAMKDEPGPEPKPSEQSSGPAFPATVPLPRPNASPRSLDTAPVQGAPAKTAKPETPAAPAPSVAVAPKEDATPRQVEPPAEVARVDTPPAASSEMPSPRAATAPLESPRVIPGDTATGSASPAIIAVPLGTERAAPGAGPPGGRQDAHEEPPMEEPVPPLASPPPAAPSQITRLEPSPVTPPPAATPPAAVELPKLDPPPGDHTMQVAQLPPSLVAFLKKLPIPKKRPLSAWPRPDDTVFRDVTASSPEAECDAALNSGILVAERLPQLGRRGGCYVPYAVKVDAIMVGRKRVEIMPPAKLRCGFALAIANWVRSDFAPAAASLGANFVGLRQLDSYNCRTMSSTRRLMSEHSMGNALDIAEVVLAGHHRAHLTDRNTQKTFRAKLRASACNRFKTVLGPGVPQHHDHIHVDLRKHYGPGGICHWNVL